MRTSPLPAPPGRPPIGVWPARLAFAAILAVAAALRLWRLDANGFGTEYYAAGVRSMLTSWDLLFFNAFDPAGFVTLDKPPVAFWIQAASASAFGFSGPAILLPQVVEGLLTVAITGRLVRRRFGIAAGLLASLFLAVTPVAVAIDRTNNTDSALLLFLVLAAWAVSRATERGSAGWLAAAMALAGVAFNIKMLAAVPILPTLALVYLVSAPLSWRRRLAHLAIGGLVFASVALSWVAPFDLVPKGQRPYAGSSRTDSMLELVVGHNGLERFAPRARRQPPAATASTDASQDRTASPAPATIAPGRQFFDNVPTGPLRLADRHLAAQFGWLLPLAALGAVAAALGTGASWPAGRRHAALLLWGGWVLTYGAAFSFAGGIFHAYYLAALAPPLAALAAIGLTAPWARRGSPTWRFALAGTLLATAAWQAHVAADDLGWRGDGWTNQVLPILVAAIAVGCALVAWRGDRARWAGAAIAVTALLALPTVWSLTCALAPGNVMLPSASLARVLTPDAPGRRGMLANHRPGTDDPRLHAFLAANRRGERFALATSNALLAAPVITRSGLPVMAIGGFLGTDPILDLDTLARRIDSGDVRFVLLAGRGSHGLRPVDEERRRAFAGWVRARATRVDPAMWRSLRPGAEGRAPPPLALYDFRPAAGLVDATP
ncbi:MAG: glycosyltransferase family 39 protein [Rhodospirillales bacterium]|nr:MAG: glycosyltransferase family 39 protein [Rhodospirillales bacterium]